MDIVDFLKKNRHVIAIIIIIINISVSTFAVIGFKSNNKHDGLPVLITSLFSYLITTLSLAISLILIAQ